MAERLRLQPDQPRKDHAQEDEVPPFWRHNLDAADTEPPFYAQSREWHINQERPSVWKGRLETKPYVANQNGPSL